LTYIYMFCINRNDRHATTNISPGKVHPPLGVVAVAAGGIPPSAGNPFSRERGVSMFGAESILFRGKPCESQQEEAPPCFF